MSASPARSIWRLRWDLLLTVILAFALACGAQWLADRSAAGRYAAYQAEHEAEPGTVGAPAPADLPRAAGLDEMESLPLFTLEMDSVTYLSNSPGGYIGSHFWNILTLEDGDRIAAKVNGASVTYTGDSWSRTAVLPVGTLVRQALTAEQLETLAKFGGVTVTDRYVDMEGGHAAASEADYTEALGLSVWFAVFVLSCVVIHTAGSKAGLFPRLLPRRRA